MELARQVLRHSQAPEGPRFTLATFALFANARRETFVSPATVAQLTTRDRSTVYRDLGVLAELGEMAAVAKRGCATVRRILPALEELEPSHPGQTTSSQSRRTVVAESSHPDATRKRKGEGRKTPLLLDHFVISRPPGGGAGSEDRGSVPVMALTPSVEASASWSEVCEQLREQLTDYAFHIWLQPLVPLTLADGVLRVWAPRHIATMVRDRYRTAIAAAAGDVGVELVCDPRQPDPHAAAPKRTNRRRRRPRAGS